MVSPLAKPTSNATYWAYKFECPVDENANYENTYVNSLYSWVGCRCYFLAVVQSRLDSHSRRSKDLDMAGLCWILDHRRYFAIHTCVGSARAEDLGANNSAWTAGATLLSLGLSVKQSMGVIVGSSFIISILAVIAG